MLRDIALRRALRADARPPAAPWGWRAAAVLCLWIALLVRFTSGTGLAAGVGIVVSVVLYRRLGRDPHEGLEQHGGERTRAALMTGRARAGLIVIGLMLASLVVWSARVEHDVPRRIAAIVRLFPGAREPLDGTTPRMFAPVASALNGDSAGGAAALAELRGGIGETYMMQTDASPDSVIAFYRDPRHRPGLELVEDDALFLLLRSADREVIVSAVDRGFGRGTLILYHWEARELSTR